MNTHPRFSPAANAASDHKPMELAALALHQHVAVCSDLLALAQRESDALNQPAPFPATAIQSERKTLLSRLDSSLNLLVETRTLWQQAGPGSLTRNPQLAALLQTASDIIMRILVLDRENEQSLLRRGLLPARSLPSVEQSRPHFVARLYQRHAQA